MFEGLYLRGGKKKYEEWGGVGGIQLQHSFPLASWLQLVNKAPIYCLNITLMFKVFPPEKKIPNLFP